MSNPEVPGRGESGGPLARSPIGADTQPPGGDGSRERAGHVRRAGPHVPHPREVLVREAGLDDEHALFWTFLYYAGLTVLVQGRKGLALAALQAVVSGEAES